MASRLRGWPVKSCAGGLNTFSNATQVEDSESPDLLNVDFSGVGAVKKRLGYQKLTETLPNSGDRIQGTFSYVTTSVRQILYIADGVLYKYDGAGGSTEITGGTFSTTANVNGVQMGTRLYFYDGVTALSYYDGTNVVTTGVSAAPTYPTQGILFNKRQYINSNANKDRVYYSKPLTSAGASTDTGNFTTGTDAGFFGFGEGYEVMGMARQQSYLYVFCKKGIFRVEAVVTAGTLDHSAANISDTVGCQASRSIDNVGNDIFFLDSVVYSLGEIANFTSLRTTNISAKVTSIFENMTLSQISRAAAINYSAEEVYLIAIETEGLGYNDRVLGYSLPYKSWFLWDTLKVNSWLEHIDATNVKHLYFGGDTDAAGYVYEAYKTANDDGAAINAYYYTKEFDSKTFDTEKIYQMWSVQFGGVYGIITIDFLVNGVVQDTINVSTLVSNAGYADGIGSLPLGTYPWGLEFNSPEASPLVPLTSGSWRRHDLDGLEGTTFQFKFSNANVSENFEIKQALVRYIDFSDRPYKVDSTLEV